MEVSNEKLKKYCLNISQTEKFPQQQKIEQKSYKDASNKINQETHYN